MIQVINCRDNMLMTNQKSEPKTLLKDNLLDELTVWDAIISWRDELVAKHDLLKKTKDEYLSGVCRIITTYPQIIENNLISFIHKDFVTYIELIKSNIDWKENTRRQRQEYLKLVHRHAVFNLRFIQPDKIPIKEKRSKLRLIKKTLSSARVLEELTTLTSEKMIAFFSRLAEINQRDFFIAKIIWLAQYPLTLMLGVKFNDFVKKIPKPELGVDEVLDMNAELLYEMSPYLYLRFKEELERLDIQSQYNLEEILTSDSNSLKRILINLLDETPALTEVLFFQTKTGNGLHSGQLISTMQLASRAAKIGFDITPKILYTHSFAGDRKDRIFIIENFNWMPKTKK